MKIISATERLANKAGIKGVIVGKAGIGKTSLLHTLDPDKTLFVNAEAGELSVQEWGGDMVRLKTWSEARNIAAAVSGGNPALDDKEPYSEAHAEAMAKDIDLSKYDTIFVDSITEVSRICFKWAQGQPESFAKNGEPDTRSAYGLLGREMIGWLKAFQHSPRVNVWLVGLLNEVKDDFGRISHVMQVEGSKTALELPGLLDEVITMTQFNPDEGEPYRAFVCQTVNEWGYPAKDRSGRLDLIEQPHLGKLMDKINAPAKPASERLKTDTPAAE